MTLSIIKFNNLQRFNLTGLFFIIFIYSSSAYAQNYINYTLTIDKNCLCQGTQALDSSSHFGIYQYTTKSESQNTQYELIQSLNIREEQTLQVEQGTYLLIYTPTDTTLQKSQFYFVANNYTPQIHLNCLFFHKNYSFFREKPILRDTIRITSTYFGPTNDETIILTEQITILREKNKYYASFDSFQHQPQQIKIQESSISCPPIGSMILLTSEQLIELKQFEQNLFRFATNDNLNLSISTTNHLWVNGKEISFFSTFYITNYLWQKLTENPTIKKN